MRYLTDKNSVVRRTALIAGILVVSAVGLSAAVWAGSPINTGHFGNVAIQGYDPVAYFTEGQARKGRKEHSHRWLGAVWRFSSEKHRNLFVANPQTYAPQYGGHCATGLAIHGGLTRDINPEAWTIVDGKLYLNYSKETNRLLTDNVVSLRKSEKAWKKRLSSGGTH
jgi:hypothetical protein